MPAVHAVAVRTTAAHTHVFGIPKTW